MINSDFTFEISLSVLNHLGRNLYRSFITVLGEAISNSWDADAKNVRIYIDRKNRTLIVKDDGIGMDEEDFQSKFLKIGYSKRRQGKTKSDKNRPYIGRKGIGKLALLSCAEKVTVLSKKDSHEYIGGVIDNSGLSEAIKNDATPDEYHLQQPAFEKLQKFTENHSHGTILFFEDLNEEIRNRIDYIKILVALYFRFSLIDQDFSIYVNDEEITIDQLSSLANSTQILWTINEFNDPYVKNMLLPNENLKFHEEISSTENIFGFIGSVITPRKLAIFGADEKVSVDLFVNGRLREKNILQHIPTTRVPESYLYGQIHFNDLDGEVDRFTSSREGIISGDPKFKKLLQELKQVLTRIIDDWDNFRIKLREDGDPENLRITKKERRARELYNAAVEEYSPPKGSPNKDFVDEWVENFQDDAQFNFSSYAECFISENLVRSYIHKKQIPISAEAQREIEKYKKREGVSKNRGNISIPIRRNPDDLGYLAMGDLAYLVEKRDRNKEACLARDADSYKPIRDALAHTSLLTSQAKDMLSSVFENIKARIKNLISINSSQN